MTNQVTTRPVRRNNPAIVQTHWRDWTKSWTWSELLVNIFFIILFSPVLLVLIPIIKILQLGSPGPLFFVQQRGGLHGIPFDMIKFRTMHISAKQGVFADRNQSELIPGAEILRRWRLDEIPQLVNVLKGEMSVVGPRPEQLNFVRRYTAVLPGYMKRHECLPGITGLSQVRMGYAAGDRAARRKLTYDMFYIRNRCLLLDFKVLFWTIGFLLNGHDQGGRSKSVGKAGRVPRTREVNRRVPPSRGR